MSLDTSDYDTDQALELPITRGGTQLATDENWATLRGCEGDVCSIYLANLSTKELWRRRPPSDRIWESFGLFDGRVFISESTPDDPPSYFFAILEYRTEAFIAGAERL